jgi:ribonuclease-3
VTPGRASEGPKALDRVLGIRFKDGSLRQTALTHRSYAFENDLPVNNERLEFLGDAVLGIVVTDMAFREHPDKPEGELAKLRAAMVNMDALADVARDLGIGRFILLGKGEEMSGGPEKNSILADAFEALLGAIYLDRGLDAARKLIVRLFHPRMVAYVSGDGPRDYKTILQELASADRHALPEYRITERGPDHEKEFTATVFLAGESWGMGIGRSKKEAEQQAAYEAYVRLTGRSQPVRAHGTDDAPDANAEGPATTPPTKGA